MEQTKKVIDSLVPFRARLYLWLMAHQTRSQLFVNRYRDVNRVYSEALKGQQSTVIDLIRLIRSDLFAYLRLWEQVNAAQLKEWPDDMDLASLRLTHEFCQNLGTEIFYALLSALVSNTAMIAYFFMMVSTYTNASLTVMVYPIAVFGYALLEETRPGKRFWRGMLIYTLAVVLLKYILNLQAVDSVISNTQFPFIDGFVKVGLHHTESTETGLVWHMLPEICLVTAILCHEILQTMQGLYAESETDIENVSQAIDRIYEVNTTG